ncbi:hypothetical protein FA743_12270 [Paracoccus gahaiensis]|uniref:Uncharacterized protein n=1 Tax=Paracoccus gahaiensis TaxID=1706839 RepID=A0A4U0R863_9RHOB|nr:hypothetical protein [Paracoccus gahaiensis]TJZ91291.1 hypothetical protein FA743_12270 [Paracoccus gahaiensis]
MTLAFASRRLGQRQVLARGRLFERLTERSFPRFDARLSYTFGTNRGTFPTVLTIRPGGWFALHLDPSRDMPDLSAAGPVRLTLTLTRPGDPPLDATLDVPGANLAVVEVPRPVAGQALTTLRVAGAPFSFEVGVDPTPVLLDGLVLRDSDQAAPAAGVILRIAFLPDRLTDAQGRFRIPALPVAEAVTLSFDEGGRITDHILRPLWGGGAMTRTFSIPSP